jgi:hypothetical protein
VRKVDLRDVGQLSKAILQLVEMISLGQTLSGQGSMRIGPQDRTDLHCKCTEIANIDCREFQLVGQGSELLGPDNRTDLRRNCIETGQNRLQSFESCRAIQKAIYQLKWTSLGWTFFAHRSTGSHGLVCKRVLSC